MHFSTESVTLAKHGKQPVLQTPILKSVEVKKRAILAIRICKSGYSPYTARLPDILGFSYIEAIRKL